MRSSPLSRSLTLLSVLGPLVLGSGCGILGTKSPIVGGGAATTGCLNNSKDLVNRFVTGEISESEWKGAFDCINESLTFFTEYVRGGAKGAYTQDDMYTLVSKFLITNREVRPELMQGAFALKAALFGGDDSLFTNDQIVLLKSSLDELRKITAGLIPYLQLRHQHNPSEAEIMELIAAFKKAGEELAIWVEQLPVGMLSSEAVETLLNELSISLNLPGYKDLSNTIFLAKWMLFNTRRDAMEADDWGKAFKTSMSLGGIILAYKMANGDSTQSTPDRLLNDYTFRELFWKISLKAKPYLQDMLAHHDGALPFPLIDHLLEDLPEEFMNRVPKDTLKRTMRSLTRKLFASTTQLGFDQGNIDFLYGFFGDMVQDLGMLDRMYEKTGIERDGLTPARLGHAIETFRLSLQDPQDIERWKKIETILRAYPALFRKKMTSEGEVYTIRFAKDTGYSHFQNALEIMLDRTSNQLLKTYSSGGTYFTETDLVILIKEYIDFLFAIRFVDPTVPNYAKNRMRDIDLFTSKSNGDNKATIEEIVNYAMIVVSATELGSRMKKEIIPMCDQGLGQDIMGWTLVPATCFRAQFEDRLEYWTKDEFPRLNAFWSTLSPEQKSKGMMWLEHGSRRNGYTNEELGKFDVGAMASILYYTESLFTRFDNGDGLNHGDERLSKEEINVAYPTFKNLLKKEVAKKGIKTNNNFLLKGVFTYIVNYKEIPLPDFSLGSLRKLAGWLIKYTFKNTNYSTDRLGIFNIVCQLAVPENANLASANKVVCSQ